MAVDTAFVEALDVHAVDDRRVLLAACGGPGVRTPGALKVTDGGGLSCAVAAGWAAIADGGTLPGLYPFALDTADVVTIGAGDPSLPRRDLVCARVRDTAYADAADDKALVVVAGTPAAVPTDPAVPARHLVLARVQMPAGGGSVAVATITDLRVLLPVEARPWGRIGSSGMSSRSTTSTSPVEVTGSSVTVTVPAGRRLKVTAVGKAKSTSSASVIIGQLQRDGGNVQQQDLAASRANTDDPIPWGYEEVPAAGTYTYRLAVGVQGGGTATLTGMSLIVEDVGGTVV